MVGFKTLTQFLLVGAAVAAAAPKSRFPSPPDNPYDRPAPIVPNEVSWCDYLRNDTSSEVFLGARGLCLSKPDASALRELAPRADEIGVEVDLSRDTLVSALTNVAAFMAAAGQDLTVVGIGGVANVVLIESRETTHDVDFFNDDLPTHVRKTLTAAMRDAQAKDSTLPPEWLNNRPVFFIGNALRQQLTREAVAQNDIIFSEPGFTMVAAPWDYQFVSKIDRFVRSQGAKPHDFTDAVDYLDRYLTLHDQETIAKTTVEKLSASFRFTITDDVINQVNERFNAQFGRVPIDVDT